MHKEKHIIEVAEISQLARPCYADEEIASICIDESEQLDLKPALGEDLFLRMFDGSISYSRLLDGGYYEDTEGKHHVFAGLKKALAYYAYARIVKNGSSLQTRFGFSQKEDQYSSRSDIKERLAAYNEAFSIADAYLKECLLYMHHHPDIFPDHKIKKQIKNNRVRFRVIGE